MDRLKSTWRSGVSTRWRLRGPIVTSLALALLSGTCRARRSYRRWRVCFSPICRLADERSGAEHATKFLFLKNAELPTAPRRVSTLPGRGATGRRRRSAESCESCPLTPDSTASSSWADKHLPPTRLRPLGSSRFERVGYTEQAGDRVRQQGECFPRYLIV